MNRIDTRDREAASGDAGDNRISTRQVVEKTVVINEGNPWKGGRLHDLSLTGAGIKYLRAPDEDDESIDVGEELELQIEDRRGFVGHVVWRTEEGFGLKFKKHR